MIIESPQNNNYKDILSLKIKKNRDNSGFFLVEGKKQFDEISDNWNIKEIVISESFNDITIKNAKTLVFSQRLFDKIASTQTPQGIIAVVEKKKYDAKKLIKQNGLFVVLENIQDPGNLGTIIRSAHAFGAKAVFVSKESADIYSDKTVRASMGSIFHIPVLDNIDIKETVNAMKNESVFTIAASINGKKNLSSSVFKNKTALVIGNEANGLKPETEKLSDSLIKINMPGNAESLNAAIAASIIMYEFSKGFKQK
ncbi:MAG: RNA methyltransferase [Endomicrobia bacterium]|nr:RNA methyltransferase [Endomicrobiia bacterium]MCL2506346.1 RNA methyltransferase [Endomicrobiia bacterium]